MQIWNVLHAASCKYRTQKIGKNSPSGHHCTTLSYYIFATKAGIDNRKKLLSSNMFLQYGELRPTSSWDPSGSLDTPDNFNGFRILPALLHCTLVGVSETLGCWTDSAGRAAITLGMAHILVILCIIDGVRIRSRKGRPHPGGGVLDLDDFRQADLYAPVSYLQF